MDLRDYLRLARKGWSAILACAVIGIALGVVATFTTPKAYRASVELFVATAASTSVNAADLSQGNTFTENQVQSYVSMATSPGVTAPVVARLGLHISPSALASRISANAPLNKVLIDISVSDRSPQVAARLANAVASQFSSYVEATVQTSPTDAPVVKLTTIHPATVPDSPTSPKETLNLALGVLLGLLVGFGIVVVRDMLDNTAKWPEDFEDADVPVLGLVPFDKRAKQSPFAFRDDAQGARAEAYRLIRASLQFVSVDREPRVIAITSAVQAEGKTTTAINLAASLAEAGNRVCVVEADLRRPTLAKLLDLSTDVGFTTVLIHQAALGSVMQRIGEHFDVLTCGPIPPNPSELLLTDRARGVIRSLAESYDYVIVDTAPVLAVADGTEVAVIADATLVVHRAGKTTREQAKRCVTSLENVGERPIGLVLNMTTRTRGDYYSYDYSYQRA